MLPVVLASGFGSLGLMPLQSWLAWYGYGAKLKHTGPRQTHRSHSKVSVVDPLRAALSVSFNYGTCNAHSAGQCDGLEQSAVGCRVNAEFRDYTMPPPTQRLVELGVALHHCASS
jgi:hypothetical protein